MPSSPVVGSRKRPLEPLIFCLPLLEEKRLVTALSGIAPIGAFPVVASFVFSCGEHERAYSGRVQNPENL